MRYGIIIATLLSTACFAQGRSDRVAVSHGTIPTYTPEQCADLMGKLERQKQAAVDATSTGRCHADKSACAAAFASKLEAQRNMVMVGRWCGDGEAQERRQ